MLLNLLEQGIIKEHQNLFKILSEQTEELMSQDVEDLTEKQKECCKWTKKLISENKIRAFVFTKLQQIHGIGNPQILEKKPSDLESSPALKDLQTPLNVSSQKAPLESSSRALHPLSENAKDKIQAMKCISTLEGHSKTPNQGRWGPGHYIFDVIGAMVLCLEPISDDTFISAGRDGVFKVWNASTGQCLRSSQSYKTHDQDWPSNLVVLPNGKFAFSRHGSPIGTVIEIWDFSTMQSIKQWPILDSCGCLIFLGQNKVATGGKSIKIWDISTGECLRILHPTVEGATFSKFILLSDEILAAGLTGVKECIIELFNISTGEHIKTIKTPDSGEGASALTKLTNNILVCGEYGKIHLFNTDSGTCFKTLEGHKVWVRSVVVLDDGVLVSASDNIKFWDPNSGECLRTIEHPEATLQLQMGGTMSVDKGCCSITMPKGGTLVGGLYTGTIELWK